MGKFLHRLDTVFGDAGLATRINSARSVLGSYTGTTTPVPPLRLQVEVTNRCNINCIMCSRHKHALELGDISPALYDKVVALSERVQETILFGYGEPLVSKAFYELLPRLRSSRFSFFTNGMIMTPRLLDRIRAEARPKLRSLVFSIDGGTKETYNRIRDKSDFDKVMENLASMADYRTSRKVNYQLEVEFVAMTDSIRELPTLFDLVDKAGADKLLVSHLVVWDEELRDQSLFYHQELCQQVFANMRQHAQGRRLQLELPYDFQRRPGPMPGCKMPWIYAMISFEGDVRACCFAPELTMGSLNDNNFDEIWLNDRYKQLRQAFNNGTEPHCCRICEGRFRNAPSPDDEATYIKLKPRTK